MIVHTLLPSRPIIIKMEKKPLTLATYPELHPYIMYIIRVLEVVYDQGRVAGLREAEMLNEHEHEIDSA